MTSEPEKSNAPESASTKSSESSHLPWWLIVAGVIGLLIFFGKDESVFPNASLDLKLSRAEIIQRCENWSRRLGYEPSGAIKSTNFSWDQNAKTFLEFELGAEKANQLMKSDVPIWYWRTRFCRESQPEEMRVFLTPTGRLQAFQWSVQNDKKIDSVSHADAQKVAEDFCASIDEPLKDCVLMNDVTETLAARTDHAFNWEQKDSDIHGAKQHYSVRVSGNVVTRFNHYLKVPDSWENKFKVMRSYNALLAEIARIFYYLLNCAAVFYFLRGVATHNIRWKLVLSIGAVFALALVLENFNNAARIFEGYSTNQSVRAYLTNHYLDLAISALRIWVLGAFFVASAESFYRVHYLDKVAVENYFRIKGLSTSQLKAGLWVGFCGGAVALGWVVFYYLVGERIGVWCPLGITNYEVLSSAYPFFSAICLGLQASVSEEILYRVFALSLARMLVKNFWLANLLQAAAWGFMHSTYPQQPAYARGIELTCSGLMFGYIMNRFGLLPSIAAHYLLDAFLDSQALLRSSVPGLQVSALLPILPLFLAALWSTYLVRRRVIPDAEASNDSIPKPVPREHAAPAEIPPFQYAGLSRRMRMILVLSLLITLPLGLIMRATPAVGDGFRVHINRQQAIVSAKEIMERHGVPTAGYQSCAWLDDEISNLEMQYVYEQVGLQKTLELAPQTQTGFMWRVRFFKPQEVDEYEVRMNGDGAEVSFEITESDDSPAPHISEETAQELVNRYLSVVDPFADGRKFINSSQDIKPARLDYTFSYVVPKFKIGEADYKLNVSVLGNRISSFIQGWIIPDHWKWARNQKTQRDEVSQAVKTAATVVLIVFMLWWVFSLLRTGTVRWRAPALLAIPVALLVAVLEVNDFPLYYRFYATIKPESTFITEQTISLLTTSASRFIETAMGIAFGLGVFKMLFPNTNVLSILRTTFKPDYSERQAQCNIWLDAISAAYALVICDWFIDCAGFALQQKFSPSCPIKILTNVCNNANVFSGALDCGINGVFKGLNEVFLIAIVAGIYAKFFRKPWAFFVFALAQSLIINSSERYLPDLYVQTATGFLSPVLYWFFAIYFAKRNILAYFLAGYLGFVYRKIPSLMEHGLPCYSLDLVSYAVLLLLPAFFTLYLLLRPKRDFLKPKEALTPVQD
ncbi:MAG TPA: CPBP family intramembrane glutamic endopeptidase [Drouetiella sp.]